MSTTQGAGGSIAKQAPPPAKTATNKGKPVDKPTATKGKATAPKKVVREASPSDTETETDNHKIKNPTRTAKSASTATSKSNSKVSGTGEGSKSSNKSGRVLEGMTTAEEAELMEHFWDDEFEQEQMDQPVKKGTTKPEGSVEPTVPSKRKEAASATADQSGQGSERVKKKRRVVKSVTKMNEKGYIGE